MSSEKVSFKFLVIGTFGNHFEGGGGSIHAFLYQSHQPAVQDVKSQGALWWRVLCNYLPVDDHRGMEDREHSG